MLKRNMQYSAECRNGLQCGEPVKFTENLAVVATKRNQHNDLNNTKLVEKTIPLQAWTGPEGSRMLRLPDFKIFST